MHRINKGDDDAQGIHAVTDHAAVSGPPLGGTVIPFPAPTWEPVGNLFAAVLMSSREKVTLVLKQPPGREDEPGDCA